MKQTVTSHDFQDAFRDYQRGDNFSYYGLRALYDWLEGYADDTGEEYELDVIALCCDFTEYSSLKEFHEDYRASDFPDMDSISDNTSVILIDDEAFIIGPL